MLKFSSLNRKARETLRGKRKKEKLKINIYKYCNMFCDM